MTPIKRWTVLGTNHSPIYSWASEAWQPDKDGEMVRFTDHVADREAAVEQAVKVERERRLAELAAKQTLNDELNNLTDRIEKMADQWEKQIEVLLRPLVPASETNRNEGSA